MLLAAATGFHVGLLATAFGFGFRHGIDWDHIAALTDITGTQPSTRRSLSLATFYALGHGLVVFGLGLGAVLLSSRVPDSVDRTMERVVGVTLIVFGLYVLGSLVRRGRAFRMRSRWMVVVTASRRLLRRPPLVVVEHEHEHSVSEVHDHAHVREHATAGAPAPPQRVHLHVHRHVARMPEDPFATYSGPVAFTVGMLHGVGGETPTQVLLFVTAAGAGGRGAGVALLVAFVGGLLASNTVVALAGAYGFVHAAKHWAFYAAISIVTAGLSVGIGALFLLGRGAVLPVLAGG